MAARYTDLAPHANGSGDFVIRKRTPTLLQLIIILLISLMMSIGVALTQADKPAFIGLIMFLVFSVGWYIVMQLQSHRDLLLTTEFQNALFASALGLNNKFCLIIKQDGNVIYLDRSFQDMFPDFLGQSRRTIDVLLEQGKVSTEDSAKVFSAIEHGAYDKVVFNIRTADKSFQKIIMSIEPILRPSGFIMLRGREFVETRTSDEGTFVKNTLLNKSTITLFSHVMDTMNMGVYMTDPLGNLVYANPVLESWLDFDDGEVISSNLSLHDIIYPNGVKTNAFEPDNYEGEVMFHRKTGGLMKCFINQKIITDERGKILGCTALIHPFTDQSQAVEQPLNVKKKLW